MRTAFLAAAFVALTPVAFAAPAEPLSLDEALALADRRNPEIVALREELEGLRTRAAEAKSPSRADKAAPAPGSADDLEERLRGARIAVAEARVEHHRVVLAAEVRSAFARCSAGRALLKISEESGVAADDALRLAEERRSQGREPPAAVEHARLVLARARQEHASIEQRLARAVVDLLELLGAPVTETLRMRGALPERSIPVEPFDSLVARALLERADLRAARAEYDAALDAQSLSARRRPGVKSGATGSRASPDVPREGETAEARIARADRALRSLENAIRVDVAAAETRVRNANVAVAASVNVPLALIADERKSFLDAYRDGSMGLSQLLAALRDAYEVRRHEVLALEELANADGDLRRAVGAR